MPEEINQQPVQQESVIVQAESLNKRLEDNIKKNEEILKRQEELYAKQILSGRSLAGQEALPPKIETPKEYKERILRGG